MIDGTNKALSDRVWNFLARPLLIFTPNQVTILGLLLVLANCAAYLVHRNSLWFGIGLTFSFVFDGLDGAVARLRGMSSKFGGYLDAVVDRYQEIAVLLALAWVNDWWLVSFLAMTGSLLTSYNKARTAIEVPINNDKWPDLMERLERLIVLCAALIFDPLFSLPLIPDGRVLQAGLWIIAIFSHITAVQRFFRARTLITNKPQDGT